MPSLRTGPSIIGVHLLAIPAVIVLVGFLGYSSQWLFHTAPDLLPGRPSRTETVIFNLLLACLWWTYYRACSVNPGRYVFSVPSASPEPHRPPTDTVPAADGNDDGDPRRAATATAPHRWCKKCQAPKPPRAHHCRHCARCIPKMDHHCPWTGNCVSLQTFPHFARFLLYTNLALWHLAAQLASRFRALWESRHLPAYLGPSPAALVHLTVLALVCSATIFALGIIAYTTARAALLNTTMIEAWEVERHEAAVERYGGGSSSGGSYWDGDGDDDDSLQQEAVLAMRAVEFPYDLGFFANLAQAMGTANPLLWVFPFAGGPRLSATPGRGAGWEWEENGFNDREGMWPPPDPEKLRRARSGWPGARRGSDGEMQPRQWGTPEEEKAAFLARQAEDLKRWQNQRAGLMAELEEVDDYDDDGLRPGGYYQRGVDGEPGWTNADGDRLRDYGVDEDAEDDHMQQIPPFEQDEDVPLGELLRRRRVVAHGPDAK